MQKQRKSYMDSRARRNLTNINTELQDVQRIMVQNIDDVLQRGETLSGQWCLSSSLLAQTVALVALMHAAAVRWRFFTRPLILPHTSSRNLTRKLCVTVKVLGR